MIVIHIGDAKVHCATAALARVLLEELRIVAVPETEREADDLKAELYGRIIGPIIAEPKGRRS
jgi:hypothetical protein